MAVPVAKGAFLPLTDFHVRTMDVQNQEFCTIYGNQANQRLSRFRGLAQMSALGIGEAHGRPPTSPSHTAHPKAERPFLADFVEKVGSDLDPLVQGGLGADRDTDCAAVCLVFVAVGCCGFCLRLSFG